MASTVHDKTQRYKQELNVWLCVRSFASIVETLEEISIQGKESFLENGGKNFDLIPCLNDNSDHIKLFETLITRYIIK